MDPLSSTIEEQLRRSLAHAVEESQAPGATACVGYQGKRLFLGSVGLRAVVPTKEPATTDTIYDLASLTKPIATTTAVMLLRDQGLLSLDDAVAKFIPLHGFEKITLRHLVTHTAGFPAWAPWFNELSGILAYVERLSETAQNASPGRERTYSDFGFILLMRVVELVAQEKFDSYCKHHIFDPLGMKDTFFNPPEAVRSRCAPTEHSTSLGRMLRGEVHDANAYALGGISGHAGLFSTAEDLERFCQGLLQGRVLSLQTLDEMTQVGQVPFYPWQGLGWWLDPWTSGSNGFLPSRHAFGHTGWTGTSVWVDRVTQNYVILLSNTCHPTREKRDNESLRRRFHVSVAALCYPHTTNTHTGLDKIVRNKFEELKGKRFALLSNAAVVDQMGRTILETLSLEPSLCLQFLYSPEHGFAGQAEAGQKVASQFDNIPLISLYGDRKEPTAEEMRQIDLFVVDLPDIGARYYTYMATMKACMEACCLYQKPILILDRPNPLGGVVLEGPIPTVFGSPVCCAPIPIRHGMTLGEIAQWFQQEFFKDKPLSLDVCTAENWWRDFLFEQTALPWKPPSPNIQTPEAALMYIGTCLFEGLNLNEGRGTETPFLLCGAPWLDPDKVLGLIKEEERRGIALTPTTYTPISIPGKASNPIYKNEACQGIQFSFLDKHIARPFTTVVALISAIYKTHPQLKWELFFDVLAGGPWLREQIQAGATGSQIADTLLPALEAFDAKRPKRYSTLEESAAL